MVNDIKYIVVLRAIPGSGKTTLIPSIEKLYGYPAVVCSADHFHYHGKPHLPENYNFDINNAHLAHKRCKEKFNEAIKYNEPLIIVDNTNIRLRDYKWYFLTGVENGYNVVFHTIRGCSVEQSFKNNVHKVPRDVIQKMHDAFHDTPKEINGYPTDEVLYDFNELRGLKNDVSNKKNNKKSKETSINS